ncbi:MAG: methyl coenzyme M reductase-arginine methyltransferase Mmp10 [Methanoregula sp.]|uniref:methyl coenzyme M reductase-arginine methyltransferase Mmp10 n=1 Tax=Methanoregula sp. TaxID=2052170 RepID=UPI003BAEE0FF
MAQLTVDIGGRAGVDCRGFCEYCYFKRVKTSRAFGCRYCLPFKKGCDYCTKGVREEYAGFKDLRTIAQETLAALQTKTGDLDRITISGGGDPSCYPKFTDLIELLGATGAPLHIGYTSGKGWDDVKIADLLIDNGLAECSFTVFAADPALRKRWMHDPTPDASLAILERLCGAADVYAAAVVLPGVNDGEVLEHTCAWLEERGAKGLILMRFANATEQGLILENAPVLKDQTVQSVESFRDLVSDLNSTFKMKISGTPLWDPEIGSPFAILHEPALLKKLPRVQRKASVITGSVAAPFISEILSARGATAPVIPVQKEIACLITEDDLREIDPSHLQPAVIIPGRAFVYDAEAQKILSRDGTDREVVRGPDQLTADAETSMGMNRREVLAMELEGFSELIRLINLHGK